MFIPLTTDIPEEPKTAADIAMPTAPIPATPAAPVSATPAAPTSMGPSMFSFCHLLPYLCHSSVSFISSILYVVFHVSFQV